MRMLRMSNMIRVVESFLVRNISVEIRWNKFLLFISTTKIMHCVSSYLILAPGPMQAEKDLKKGAGICLESVALDPEMYRLGHTKARIFSNLL